MRLELDLQFGGAGEGVPERKEFARWARATLAHDNVARAALCIRIVDENESAQLNETYRKKQGPTNVLSFLYEDTPGLQSDMLGDIIICAPVIAKEATQQNKPLQAHWAHMVIHGILHLRGYTHDTDKTANIMEKMETEVMHTLGYPDPYA